MEPETKERTIVVWNGPPVSEQTKSRVKKKGPTEQEAVFFAGGKAPDNLAERLSFEEADGGSTHHITVDGKPAWVSLQGLEGWGRYKSYGKANGTAAFYLDGMAADSGALGVIEAFDKGICQKFSADRAGAPVGTLFMSEATLGKIFRPSARNKECLVVNVSTPVGIYDTDGHPLSGDMGEISFDRWKCNLVVQPCWLHVKATGATVHWRLRQIRFLSHPEKEVVADRAQDSDYSI